MRRIVLRRSEGQPYETIRVVLSSFDKANDMIRAWAKAAPPQGEGHHKVGVEATWSDDTTLDGVFELNRQDATKSKPLQDWMRNRLEVIAGLWKPIHMTCAQYDAIRSSCTPEQKLQALETLNEHEL